MLHIDENKKKSAERIDGNKRREWRAILPEEDEEEEEEVRECWRSEYIDHIVHSRGEIGCERDTRRQEVMCE